MQGNLFAAKQEQEPTLHGGRRRIPRKKKTIKEKERNNILFHLEKNRNIKQYNKSQIYQYRHSIIRKLIACNTTFNIYI